MSTRNREAVRRLHVVDAPKAEKPISFAALESTSTDVNNPHTSFNARLYWRIILLKAFLESSQREMSEEEVEELLAFFSQVGEEAANQRQEPPRKRRAA